MDYKSIPHIFYHVTNKFRSKDLFKYKENGKSRKLNYNHANEMVHHLGLGLLKLGIHSGDRVGILADNRIEWFVSYISLLSIGAVAVPIFPSSTSEQIEYICDNCAATAIIVSNNFQLAKVMEFKDRVQSLRHVLVMNEDFQSDDLAVYSLAYIMKEGKDFLKKNKKNRYVEESIERLEPNDLCTLIYTSGTTGDPKGVMLSHRNIISNIVDAIKITGLNEKDVLLSYLPWCHAYELTTGLMSGFTSGATICIADSVETVAQNLIEYKPTYLTTVPKLLEIIMKRMKAALDKESDSKQKMFEWAVNIGKEYFTQNQIGKASLALRSKYKIADKMVFSKIKEKTGGRLKCIVSGGAPLPLEVDLFFLAAGFIVMEGYGLTEAAPIVAVTMKDDIEPGTIGKPIPSVEVKLAEDGELLVRGPNIMKGYWGDPEATNLAIDRDGWLYTGDIAIVTERGNIKITDRKKNIFVNTGGKNIAPQPIESVLSQSQYIEQVILLGDNREYITALITPDFKQLEQLAELLELKYDKPDDLISHEKIIKAIKMDIDRLQEKFAKYERVRKFRLISSPFTIESGELTPKMSIKRHVVERNYSFLIDEMYNVG